VNLAFSILIVAAAMIAARNPRRFEGRCGFGPRVEPRLAEMPRGVDLSGVEVSGAS